MIIQLKNKNQLIVDDFIFKCCVGKNGLKKQKIEGDKTTPKGIFKLETVYYRKDRVKRPITKIKKKIINKKRGWCNDPKHKFYNKEVLINKKVKHEKLFRKDYKYNYFIDLDYNKKKTIKNKGSAIFIHLTKNYKPTAGCIAIKRNDFEILLKIIDKNTKILIN